MYQFRGHWLLLPASGVSFLRHLRRQRVLSYVHLFCRLHQQWPGTFAVHVWHLSVSSSNRQGFVCTCAWVSDKGRERGPYKSKTVSDFEKRWSEDQSHGFDFSEQGWSAKLWKPCATNWIVSKSHQANSGHWGQVWWQLHPNKRPWLADNAREAEANQVPASNRRSCHLCHQEFGADALEKCTTISGGDTSTLGAKVTSFLRISVHSSLFLWNTTFALSILREPHLYSVFLKFQSEIGYARAWVRLALERKSLAQLLRTLVSDPALLTNIYKRYAFLRSDEEREQALHHLQTLTTVEFSCFTNAYANSTLLYQVLTVLMIMPSQLYLSSSLSMPRFWSFPLHPSRDRRHVLPTSGCTWLDPTESHPFWRYQREWFTLHFGNETWESLRVCEWDMTTRVPIRLGLWSTFWSRMNLLVPT